MSTAGVVSEKQERVRDNVMSLLGRFSMGAKLMFAPTLIVVLLIGISVVAYQGLNRQQKILGQIEATRFSELQRGLEISSASQAAMVSSYAAIVQLIRAQGSISKEALQSYVDEMQASVNDMLAGVAKTVNAETKISEQEQALYEKLAEQADYFAQGINELGQAILENPALASSQLGYVRADYNRLQGLLGQLIEEQKALAGSSFEEANATADKVALSLEVSILVAIVLSLLTALLVRRQVLRAIKAIELAAMRLKKGDLTHRVEIMGRDELAQTASAFNELIDSLQYSVMKVVQVSRSVDDSAEALVGTSDQVAEGAQKQAGAAVDAANTMDLMSQEIASIASHVEDLRATAQESLQGSEAGRDALDRLLQEISRVKDAFASITDSVGDFVSSTTEITNSINQVKDLSGQTNLLALNAAIEAARAGENGRGFSVVAEEVRSLAQRSALAANSINELTENLEAQSHRVNVALEEGSSALDGSQSLLEELERVLSEATRLVGSSNDGVDEIAQAVHKQNKGGKEIAGSIERIAEMGKDGNQISHTVRTSVASLRELSKELAQSVSHFET